MRISTVTMFEQSVSSMNRQQTNFMDVGQQIASGRRVVNPSDDPQAASRAVGVSQSIAVNEQQKDSRVTARNALRQEDSILSSIGDAITSAKTLIVQAGNGVLGDADRDSIASEINGIYEELIGQANATNGNGSYLFGGYRDGAEPFKRTNGATETDFVDYVGDQGVRTQQVDASRQMPVGDSGSSIFMSLQSGAGYVAEAKSGNEGSLTFTGPNTLDAGSEDYGKAYTISFTNDGTKYSITDGDGNTVVSDADYEDGKVVTIGSALSITLEGQPEAGDEITVAPAQEQYSSLFDTLKSALDILQKPVKTDADQAALENTMAIVGRQLDNAYDNVLTVQSSVGSRLNELDVLDSVGANRDMSYEQTLSDLVDLDYNKAVSDYALRQVGLQAAQKAFVDVQGMSLLNFLK